MTIQWDTRAYTFEPAIKKGTNVMTGEKIETKKAMEFTLRDIDTKEEIKVGDEVTLSDGSIAELTYLEPPHKPASQGKVIIEDEYGVSHCYYASVINAEYVTKGFDTRKDRE